MLQCKAVYIQLIVERVDSNGEIVEERITGPQKLFARYWPTIPALVEQAIESANADEHAKLQHALGEEQPVLS